MHVAVLQLLFNQYNLCTGFHLHSQDNQLLSLCMWQYYSYCSINSGCVPIFNFIPTIYNYCHYTCGSTTVTVRSILQVLFFLYKLCTVITLHFPIKTIIVTIHVAVLQLLFYQYTLYTGIPLHVPRYSINFTLYVPVLQLQFDQYTLYTGIPLHFPRYTIIVTIHFAVLQLMLNQFMLCTGIPPHFQ